MLAATLKFAARVTNEQTLVSTNVWVEYFMFFILFISGITTRLLMLFIRPWYAKRSAILLNGCGGFVWDQTFHNRILLLSKCDCVMDINSLYANFNFLLGVVIKGMKL